MDLRPSLSGRCGPAANHFEDSGKECGPPSHTEWTVKRVKLKTVDVSHNAAPLYLFWQRSDCMRRRRSDEEMLECVKKMLTALKKKKVDRREEEVAHFSMPMMNRSEEEVAH